MNAVGLHLAEEFERRYELLPTAIQRKAERRADLFKKNPFNPVLETEKLHTPRGAVWSFRIDRKYRIIFRFLDAGNVVLLTVGPHDWVYRQLHRFF